MTARFLLFTINVPYINQLDIVFRIYLTRFKQENGYLKNNTYHTESKTEKYEITVN